MGRMPKQDYQVELSGFPKQEKVSVKFRKTDGLPPLGDRIATTRDELWPLLQRGFEKIDNDHLTPPTRANTTVEINDRAEEILGELSEEMVFDHGEIDEYCPFDLDAYSATHTQTFDPVTPDTTLGDDLDIEEQFTYLTSSEVILSRLADRDPDTVFALVSGGYDSLTALAVAIHHPDVSIDGILHINTGIGIPDTREFVKARAEAYGIEYIELKNEREGERYLDLVNEYGFPSPAVHKWMYVNLKQKPLQRFLSNYSDSDVALISGVRRGESERRMRNISPEAIEERDGVLWVSPVSEWSGIEIRKYRRENDLPSNPTVEIMEMSGECLCGSFAHRKELNMLRTFYPDIFRHLANIEGLVMTKYTYGEVDKEYTLWGHGQMDDRELEARGDSDQMTLCTDCEQQDACGYKPTTADTAITQAELTLRDR